METIRIRLARSRFRILKKMCFVIVHSARASAFPASQRSPIVYVQTLSHKILS